MQNAILLPTVCSEHRPILLFFYQNAGLLPSTIRIQASIFIFPKRRLTCFAFSECMLTRIADAYTVYGPYIKIPQCMLVYPKKLYTLERKPPSAFVRPVVGEGLCTLTDFVQNSQRG